jgi:cytidyltransferase-like protein
MRVVVSGYFNPLHIGHLEMFKKAKAIGDKLIVIVNNDKQQMLKRGFIYMTQSDRRKIVESIKWVDEVVVSIDEDRTVCKTLEMIKPDIFANGGDRFKTNIPEKEVCDRLGIKMVFGLGKKIRSSSDFI